MKTVKTRYGDIVHLEYPLGGALCGFLRSAVDTPGKLPTCPRCIGIWNGTHPGVDGRPVGRIRGSVLTVRNQP